LMFVATEKTLLPQSSVLVNLLQEYLIKLDLDHIEIEIDR
jgi:hypothetical protein